MVYNVNQKLKFSFIAFAKWFPICVFKFGIESELRFFLYFIRIHLEKVIIEKFNFWYGLKRT